MGDYSEIKRSTEGDDVQGSQSKRQKQGDEEEEQSFLTPSPFESIPSHIIPSILTHLPVDEAARTSALSHKWKDSWTWIRDLNLNLGGEKNCCLTAKQVDHILSSHRGETISTFRVALCVEHHSAPDVNRWVKFAERKGVHRLALLNCRRHRDQYNRLLRKFAVGCESLTALELSRCELGGISSFQESKNLKTLKLQNVALKPDTLECIVTKCLSLESLLLRECSGKLPARVRICSPSNLRMLELTKFGGFVPPMEIRAKSLRVLVTDMVEKIEKIDSPDLEILSSGHVCFEDTPHRRYEPPDVDDNDNDDPIRRLMLSSPTDAEFLGHYFGLHGESPVESETHEFDKLQGLFINLDLDPVLQNILLAIVLRKCTHLRELDIKLVQGCSSSSGRWVDMANYWETKVSPDSIAQRLKKTRLRGFTGKDLQLGFAKFLITKAPVLGKLRIRFRKNIPEEFVEAISAELLSLPRASLDLSIEIDSHSCLK